MQFESKNGQNNHENQRTLNYVKDLLITSHFEAIKKDNRFTASLDLDSRNS